MSDKGVGPPRPSQSSSVPTAMVYVTDKESEGIIRQCLNGIPMSPPYYGTGGIKTAIEELSKRTSPPLLIVDIEGVDEPLAALRALSDVCEPGTGVMVIGLDNDIRLYRELKASGIAEYFFKPLVSTLVTQMCNAILSGTPGETSVRTGKLVIVLGVRGGAGTTTIATRLAWHLAQERKRRVMFVDLDLKCGDASLQMDVKPQHALYEALEHPERVDDLFLERGVTHITERLNLLASLEPLDSVINYHEDSAISLVTTLLRNYRYVFVDLPAVHATRLTRFLYQPCIILLVSDSSLASARDVLRWRALIGPNTAERITLHILNKSDAPGGLPIAELSRATGNPPDIVMPFDRSVAAAGKFGIRELEKCRGFFQALGPALQAISGEPAEAKPSFMSRIFR